MHIVVKGKNMDVTEALRGYAEKRLAKIAKYFDTIISTDVTLSYERSWHIVEVTVFANGFVLRGEERTNDMYTSIDKVTDKLESQIKKQKGKVTRKGRHATLDGNTEPDGTSSAVAVLTKPDEDELLSIEPHVERIKRFASTPMTLEQAVKEIEAMDWDFYVFFNSGPGRVNVLYRRQRGYGLIDPILDEPAITVELRQRLAQVPDVDVSPSMFRDDAGFWVNGTEVAHVSGSYVEIRLGRTLIRSQRGELKLLPSVRLRGSSSDWVDVLAEDGETCLSLFRQAVTVYQVAPGELSMPPPTGAALSRRRRFH